MALILKLMMLVLTLLCVGFAIVSVIATKEAAKADRLTVEEAMRRRPGISRVEAERDVSMDGASTAIASGCCVLGGAGTAGLVWFAGMLPLTVLYLVFRPKSPIVVQLQQQPPPRSKY